MCAFESVELDKISPDNFRSMRAEINSEGFYELECPNGHKSITWVQNEQFEILFDSAVLALLDGYYREAVSSFASSLERFYEFSIRVMQNNIEEYDQEYNEEFDKLWKSMSKQSERQLGAYYMAYFNEFKKNPPAIQGNWIEFRNKVIHKGEFPSLSKSLLYGEYIYNYMVDQLIELRKRCPIGFNKPASIRIRSYDQKGESYLPVTNVSLATCINVLAIDDDKKNFEDVMKNFKSMQHFQYSK